MSEDPRIAALAEALRSLPVPATYEEWQARIDASYEDDAAAILAALPPDWCGHHAASEAMRALAEQTATIVQQEDEIARLRRIEEAARAISNAGDPDDDFEGQYIDYLIPATALDALRAALEEGGLDAEELNPAAPWNAGGDSR
jgi:hypothetical protein